MGRAFSPLCTYYTVIYIMRTCAYDCACIALRMLNAGQIRVMFRLRDKPGLKWGIAGDTGHSVRYVENALQRLMGLGLVHSFRRGIAGKPHSIGNYMLTPQGYAYADQLANELGPNEVERLLTPKVGKGKRAAAKRASASLSDSIGL